MGKKEIQAKGVPPPSGLYSRGVVIANPKKLIFLSGLCGYQGGGMREQTLEIYRNITNLLKEAGATWDNVVKILTFIKDINKDFEEYAKAKNDFFKEAGIKPPYPASTGVQAKMVHEEYLIEIEVTAAID